MKNYYSPEQAYGNSKAAQIAFTKHLGNMMDTQGHDIKVVSIHPGVVFTDLYVNVWWMKIFSLLAKYVFTILHECYFMEDHFPQREKCVFK